MAPGAGTSIEGSPQTLPGNSWLERVRSGLQEHRFLITFALLASLMGTSVGMAQVSASLYALELGSSGTMLGLIAGSQSLGVLLMSLPIGMLVDRVGPTRPFLVGTLLAGLIYAVVPLGASPGWLLSCTAAISFFMPLRFVALNTVFLQQLQALGEGKAGWYRGTHMVGMFLLGPALGARAVQSFGFGWTYRLVLLGLGLGSVQIATLTRYAQLGSARGYGRVSGLSALVGPSGGVFGNLLGGLLGKYVGLQSTFLLAAAGFALGIITLRSRATRLA